MGVDARLKSWIQAGKYVDQNACEYERKIHLSGAHNMIANPGETSKQELKGILITDTSMCIAEDDPQMK